MRFNLCFGTAFLFILLVSSMQSHAQATKSLADEVTFTSPDDKMTSLTGCGGIGLSPCYSPTVQNPSNALVDDGQFARLLASPGLLAGLGSYDGELELRFPEVLPGDTWSYVRIGADESLLQALLGGSLGELLSDVLGTVLLGNQEIEIQARNGVAAPVLSRTSVEGFDTDRVRLVQNGDGDYFLAIKPDSDYDRIRIINRSTSLAGLGAEYTLDVYAAFYLGGDDTCGEFGFTSFDGEGISLDVLDLGGAGVVNAQNALDVDSDSYSEISIGTLGVGASMFQSIYYGSLSAPEDYFKIKLSVANGGVLTADLIGGIEVRAFNGPDQVYITKLQGGLINGLDLLTLFQNGEAVTIPFGPGVSFDRITIGYNSLVSLSALSNSPIRVYDVRIFGDACPDPDPIPLPAATDPMLSSGDCVATVLAFENANFPFNTVDGNNDTYSTLTASSGVLLGSGAYDGFIELGFDSRAAGTSSYVRIDFDEEVLLGLLDGTVGQLLGGVVDNVLFGSHYFTVEVKNNGVQVFESSSSNGFFNQPIKIVQDKNNHFYVEVTPESPYTSIRITESLGAIAGLGEVRSMNVYHVCSSTGFEVCEQAFATYSESAGISLDLLGLGAAGVTDAGFAIDGNPATASEISIGAAGIGSSVYQVVDFHSLSAPADHFRVKLAMEGGNTLTAEVLGSIVIKAFDGDTEVFSQDLRDGLISGLDLLGLLQGGGTLNLPFGPGLAFDRVAVGIESLVSANVIQNPVKIFSIERFSAACPDPELAPPTETIPPFTTSDCAGEVVSWENANFPLNAADGNNDSYAILSASAGTALGLGSYSSHIELKYAAPVAAGETSYVRIEFENDELNALLGGSLGSDLADLLGSIALGDHYFTVTPKTAGGTDIYTASSATGFGNQDVRVVQDESGRFYIAFTADQPYQSVRIDHYLAALIGAENTATMHVYSMCRETEFDLCEQATFTDFDGSGIAVDLLDITKGGVFNPQNAIDGNSSNYSTINLGVAGVGASVYQNIYFKTKSQNTDALRIRAQLDEPGILNLDIAGSYRVILYNGSNEVYNESLQDALINNLDVLSLLNSGGIQELLIEPGMVYDRVSFGLESAVAINTSAPIRLYGISRISDGCPDPDVADPPYLSPMCAEELIDATFADNLANLFDGNFNSFATINSSGGALLTGIGAYSGHITLGFGSGVIVPAGTTSYMRIDTDQGILDALLGGSVGSVLSDLLNTVILGDHYFNVIVNDAGGNPIFIASSDNGFAGFNDQVKLVQDALGRYYLAITPNSGYNSITIEDHTDALLLGQDNSINIYGLCYDAGAEACATGFTTSFDGSGITVDVGAIGSYGVSNAERALDNNNNDDYSEISLGTLGVAGSIQQNIQFRQTIPAEGSFKIKLGIGAGVLDADVFGRIDVIGYLDGVEVYDETLENAVLGSVNLVDLFNNGANEEIRVSPGVPVDEVAIRLRSLVSVTAVPNVRLYYILQDCETPLFQAWESYVIDGDPSLTSVSGGETVVYTIHVRNTGTVPMTGYQITDAIPAHTTYVSGGIESAGVVTFENIDIAPGATETVSFTVLVDENLTEVPFVSNVALVRSLPGDPGTETYPALDNENPTDPDESGDTGTDIPVDPIFSAELWKSVTIDGDASVSTVSGGETLVYTIYLRNTGNQDLTYLTIADALPSGIDYVSGGALNGIEVNFTLVGLAVGATSTVGSFTATVDADLTGIDEIRNIAIASSSDLATPIESYPPVDNTNPTEPDTAADPGTVTDVTPVHAIDFDKIGLSDNAESDGKAVVGDIITYTLTVTNTGNKTLDNISVVDQLPANTTVVDNGGGTAGTGTLTFDIASLAVGAMQEFTFTVEVDAVTGSDPIVNNAEAFYPDTAGGSASETAQYSMPTDCVTVDADDIMLTADQSAICEGESTILHASLNGISIPDAEFRWYLDAGLSGPYFSGADYEVNPTSTTTYYVTVVAEGYCFSTPAATTAITVNELPAVPSTSSDITISEGFGTVLTASIDPMPAGVEIVWYAEGGAELATGNSYTTGVLSAGVYTYYAGTRNTTTGCLSIDTTAITVTVEPVTTDTDCTIANAQNNGTYFLCLLCSVENPGNAVDGNIDSYSRFVAPVAVTGGVWQELIFNQTGAAGDTIVITLGTGGSLLDLGVLSGLSFESYNGTTANGDGGVVDNNLISLSLLGGDSKGEVRFVAGGSFDRVRIEYRPLLGALESGWRIYQARINYPAPTAVTDGAEVCVGETATLEATPSAGTSLRWYDAESGGALLASGNSYTTAPLDVPGTVTYYISVLRGGCEDPARIPVNVTVNPRATASDITAAGGTICEGNTFTLSASSGTVTNPVFRFYEDENLTTEITDLSVSPAATTTYYVTVSGDGVCENAPGDAAEVVVTVNLNAVDADININNTVTQCEGEDVVLMPTTGISNPVFSWYFDAGKTNPITSGTVSGVDYGIASDGSLTVSGLAAGSTTEYFVTVSGDGVCENTLGKSVSVSITNSLDAPEFVEDELEVCGTGTDVTFEISNDAGGLTYMVYDAATGGNIVANGIQISGNEIILSSVDADVEYFVGVMGGSGCESMDRTRIAVTVLPPATAADISTMDLEICEGESVMLSATSGTVTNPVFRFYTSQDLATEITDLEVSPTATTTYYVTVSGDGVCENAPGDATELTVAVNPLPAAPGVGSSSVTITEGFATQLVASAPTGSTVVWYSDAGAELATGPTFTTQVLSEGTYTYFAASRDDVTGCESAGRTMITVVVIPATPIDDCTVANAQTVDSGLLCLLCFATTPEQAVDGNENTFGRLTVPVGILGSISQTLSFPTMGSAGDSVKIKLGIPGGLADVGLLSRIEITLFNGGTQVDQFSLNESLVNLTVLGGGTVQQAAVLSSGSFDRVRVRLTGVANVLTSLDIYQASISFASPTAVTDGAEVCVGETATLEATPSAGTSLRWYDAESGGALLASGNSYTTAPLDVPGTVTYYIAVLRGGCENPVRIPVNVTVNPGATGADIQSDGGIICEGETFTLSATTGTVSNPVFRFYTSQDLTAEITDLEVSPVATTTYYVTVSGDGVCENSPGEAATVTVTVNPRATASDIQSTGGTICEGDTFTLSASSATVSNPVFRFYEDEDLTTEITDLSVSPATTTTYYVTVSGDGVCENAPGDAETVTVTVNPRATASDIQSTEGTICEGESFTLSATTGTVTNPVFRFYTSQDLTAEITDLEVSPVATTTYYVTVSGDGVCENSPGEAATVTVTVNPRATASDIQSAGGTICVGDSFTLSASSATVSNPVFRFYEDEDLTTEITDLAVSPAATTTYYVTVSGDGVCENSPSDAAEVVVTVNPRATASDIQSAGGTICEGDTFTLSGTSSTVSNPVFRFYEDEDLTTEITDLTVSPATTTTYYVTVSGDGVCENAPGDAAMVTVMVNPQATASDITVVGGTICEGDSFTLSASSATVSNPVFQFYEDEDLTTEITDLSVSPATTTTYYVTVSGDGVCENSPGDAAMVTVTVNPRATASDIDATGGTICEGDTFTLSASSGTVTNPVFRFYEDENLTTEITDLSVSPAATTTYYVTVSGDGVCENAPGDAAMVTVTVNPRATASDIDATGGKICEGDTFTLSATSGTVTNPVFQFYEDEDLTTEITDLTVSPTTTTTYYVTVSGDGVCENAPGDAAMVTVMVNPQATASDITVVGGTICVGDSFALSASSATVSNPVFRFYEDEDLTAEITDLTVSPTTTTTYYVTVSGDGVCENAPGDAAMVTVMVNPRATASDIQSAGGTICEGDTFTLSASSATVTNPVFRFYEDEDLTTEITDLSVSPAATTTYYVTVSGDGVCESNLDEAVEIIVNVGREALSSDVQVMNAVICEGESTVLTASSSTVVNPVFRFYRDEALTEEVTDLNVSPSMTTRYYVTVTGDEVCESKVGEAAHLTVTVRTVSPPEVSNPNQTFCGDTDNPTLASIEITGTGIKWYETLTGGTALAPSSPLKDGVTYYASQTDPATGCESLDRAAVTIALTLCDMGDGLQVSKAASSPTVFPGGEVTYTISVSNTASLPMSDITVEDELDSDLTFVSASNEGTFDAGTVTWSVPTIPANATIDLTLTVLVSEDATAGTMISNVAVVSSPDDPEGPKESDPEVVEVVDPTVFTVEKTPNVLEARIGDEVVYSITVSNVSSVVKEAIEVTDTLPTGLNYLESDQRGMEVNGVVSWTIPSLAPGQNIVLTVVTEVSDEAVVGSIIYNTAVIYQPDEDPIESDPGDGVLIVEDEDEEPEEVETLISVAKWTDATTAVVGQMIDYTIHIENIGDEMAYNLMVVDSLPAGTMAVEVSPEGEISDNAVVWMKDSLDAGASMDIIVKLMVTSNEGPISNWVYVSGSNFPDISTGTDPLDPVTQVDLMLNKEVSASLIQVNSIFEYKITLTNNSTSTSSEVVVTDVLSTSVEYIGADVTSGAVSYNLDTRTLTWNIATVGPLEVETMNIRVKAVSEGTVSNTATSVSADEELEPTDNTDTVSHEQLVFEIPNVFTPNGDGINDTWVIRGLQEFFQQNELVIVNRWGVEVYRADNYQNDWNGENLNGGTYFYQFQLTDSQGVGHAMTGYVTIIK